MKKIIFPVVFSLFSCFFKLQPLFVFNTLQLRSMKISDKEEKEKKMKSNLMILRMMEKMMLILMQ